MTKAKATQPKPNVTKKAPAAKPAAGALARPGDPYVDGAGRVVPPPRERAPLPRDNGAPNAHITPESFRPADRRSMRDLPASASIMNGVSAIFIYTMMGVSDREIAETLNCTVIDVQEIRAMPAYGEVFDNVMKVFIDTNSELLSSRIAAYTHNALTSVADLIHSDDEAISLRASQDILDRGGARPADMVAKKAAVGNELRIIVSKPDAGAQVNVNVNIGG